MRTFSIRLFSPWENVGVQLGRVEIPLEMEDRPWRGAEMPLQSVDRPSEKNTIRGSFVCQSEAVSVHIKRGAWVSPEPQANASLHPWQVYQDQNEFFVSIIAVGRNDMHGAEGNFTFGARMQSALHLILHMACKHEVRAEILLVDFNPDTNQPTLSEFLSRIPECPIPVRIITVPKRVRDTYVSHLEANGHTHHSSTPLFEYVGKNIAARRARGKFLLMTNGDDVLSSAVMHLLSLEYLDESSFYRVKGRKEINFAKVLQTQGHSESSLKTRLSMLEKVGGISIDSCWHGEDLPLLTGNSGDFLLAPRKAMWTVHGHYEVPSNAHLDTFMVYQLASHGYRQVFWSAPCVVFHQSHAFGGANGTRPKGSLSDFDLEQKSGKQRLEAVASRTAEMYTLDHATARGASNRENWGWPWEEFEERFLE